MNAEQIRAEAIEVLARTEWDAWKASFDLLDGGDGPQAPPFDDAPADHVIMHGIMRQAARDIDALAAAGLLPTGVDEGYIGRSRRRRRRYVTDWQEVTE